MAVGCTPKGPSLQTEIAETVIVRVADGVGSGVILGPNTVLTAAHVTDQDTATIETHDGQKVQAKVTFIWKQDDFAILRTVETLHEPVATLAIRAPCDGETVTAIGDALDMVPWFVSRGVVANTHVPAFGDKFSPDLVAADLTLVPGMSGGPVFNADGEVIGLSDAVMPFRLGITRVSFIVPSEAIWHELKNILPSSAALGL